MHYCSIATLLMSGCACVVALALAPMPVEWPRRARWLVAMQSISCASGPDWPSFSTQEVTVAAVDVSAQPSPNRVTRPMASRRQ